MNRTGERMAQVTLLAVSGLVFSSTVVAQGATDHSEADQLAKQLSNPVAALISVPFQFNYDTGFGPDDDGERWLLNVQPVELLKATVALAVALSVRYHRT